MERIKDLNIVSYKKEVIKHFEHFYKDVDQAHGLSHVLAVTNLALDFNSKLGLDISEYDIIVAGISHDIFSFTHRNEHHTKARDYILQDTGAIYEYVDNKEHIAYAVGEHRGSYKGEYTSLLSELISAADRGLPTLSSIIKRIYQCAIDPNLIFRVDKIGIPDMSLTNNKTLVDMVNRIRSNNVDETLIKTYIHLYEKYSIGGYARYNDVYKKVYSQQLCDMWNEIERIGVNPKLLLGYLPERYK